MPKQTVKQLALSFRSRKGQISEGEWLECCIVRCTQQTKQRAMGEPLCDRHLHDLEDELRRLEKGS